MKQQFKNEIFTLLRNMPDIHLKKTEAVTIKTLLFKTLTPELWESPTKCQ